MPRPTPWSSASRIPCAASVSVTGVLATPGKLDSVSQEEMVKATHNRSRQCFNIESILRVYVPNYAPDSGTASGIIRYYFACAPQYAYAGNEKTGRAPVRLHY